MHELRLVISRVYSYRYLVGCVHQVRMQISLLCFVRTRECLGIAGIRTIQLQHLHRVQDWIAMPPRDATGDMLLAQAEGGEHGEAAQPAFLPFPRHARVWHASRWLGIKKGLHIIRRPANLPGRFVPKCQPRWTCCARVCTYLGTLSILAHPRLAIHWLYS